MLTLLTRWIQVSMSWIPTLPMTLRFLGSLMYFESAKAHKPVSEMSHCCYEVYTTIVLFLIASFYPRPVLAFGYCHRLRLCVCPCVCQSVCQSLACPRDNSGPVQARIAEFGPKMQKTLVRVPIVLGGKWPWPSRSNWTWNQNLPHFEFVRNITHYPFKLGSPNLDQRWKTARLRSLLFWVAIDLDLQGQI